VAEKIAIFGAICMLFSWELGFGVGDNKNVHFSWDSQGSYSPKRIFGANTQR
jgi:hypothetical protein